MRDEARLFLRKELTNVSICSEETHGGRGRKPLCHFVTSPLKRGVVALRQKILETRRS